MAMNITSVPLCVRTYVCVEYTQRAYKARRDAWTAVGSQQWRGELLHSGLLVLTVRGLSQMFHPTLLRHDTFSRTSSYTIPHYCATMPFSLNRASGSGSRPLNLRNTSALWTAPPTARHVSR